MEAAGSFFSRIEADKVRGEHSIVISVRKFQMMRWGIWGEDGTEWLISDHRSDAAVVVGA